MLSSIYGKVKANKPVIGLELRSAGSSSDSESTIGALDDELMRSEDRSGQEPEQ